MANMPAPGTIQGQFGQHTLTFEPPSILHCVLRGDISAPEMEGIAAFIIERGREHPFVLVMTGLTDLGAAPASTRKVVLREVPKMPVRGLAYYGGGFQRKILLKLVLSPLRVFTANTRIPVRFFDTEPEARAWLEQRARELSAR